MRIDQRSIVLSCLYLGLIASLFLVQSCSNTSSKDATSAISSDQGLKDHYKNAFYLGAALGIDHITGSSSAGQKLVLKEFNTVTPENIMKWVNIHPSVDSFHFELSDQYVALGEENDMHIVGHALVWHSQIGEYMNKVTDSTEMAHLIDHHIRTIVSRYKGRIDTWDVVNEALNEDGTYRESNFYNVMGESYLALAFKLARAADPRAQLVYNDYNIWKPEKRDGVIRMVEKLRKQGVEIDAIGMQGHYSLVGPEVEDVENSIIAFAANGLDVQFSELDITALPNPWDLEGAEISQNFKGSEFMDPYQSGLPDSAAVAMSDRYKDLFSIFLKHSDKISRVTFWGVNNQHSWLNNWPIEGRTNYPLLFDRNYNPTKAYHQVAELAK